MKITITIMLNRQLTNIFFDLETYSPGEKPHYDDEIIAIAYQIEKNPIRVLRCWESGEKDAIVAFIDDIHSQPYPTLIGHNVLRFDLPILINRASIHGIDSTSELLVKFLGSMYTIDLLQTLLPTNNFRFKGLRMEDCSRKLGYEHKTCKGNEIALLYEMKDYGKITEHIVEDIEANVRLYRSLEDGSYYG